MEKGQGKRTDTLQTNNVLTRKEYIEREAFIAEHRHWYCDNCERRKGMKNGKMKFVYAIGEVPCRACDIGDMLNSIEDYPAADVMPVVRCGECKHRDPEDRKCDCGGLEHAHMFPVSDDWFCADGDRSFKPKPQTNADRIRAMTDEELEVWLVNLCCASVGDAANARVQIIRGNLLNWLKQEVNE